MNSIKDIQDEKVRRLAETLRQSGLAASETEAIRMASDMTNTGDKVNKNFDEKKDQNIMGLSHLNKNAPLAEAVKEPSEELEPEEKELCKCGPECMCNKNECDCVQEATSEPEVAENEEVIEQELAGEPEEKAPAEESQTEEKPASNGSLKVKFLSNLPKFMGLDKKVYGPYDKDSTGELPSNVAELLLKKGRAELVS